MRIELVKRPQQSALFSALSPFIALALTLIAGGIMFSLLGKNPVDALYYYFVDPLRELWSLEALTVKAAPLILIAVGLSICYLSNNWNIGAEGQFVIGGITGSILPVLVPQFQGPLLLPLMLLMGMAGGGAVWRHTGAAQDTLQHQRDPDQPDAGLHRPAFPRLAGARLVA